MNALTQYIELYKAHRSKLESGYSPAVNALRAEALQVLEHTQLPAAGSENYEHTDLQAILAPDYGLNLDRLHMGINPADTFSCKVPNISTSLFFLAGDSFAATPISGRHLPQGVRVCSLRHAVSAYPEIVEPYLGKIADMSNPLVALNTLLWQDGLLVYLPAGVKLERPLQLVSMLQGVVPMMAVRRLLIVMEPGSQACMLCCDHTQHPELSFLNLQTIEVHLGQGAHLDIYELEESTQATSRLSTLYMDMHQDSNALVDEITLYNGTTRNETYARMLGTGAELQVLGMGIEDAGRRLDNYSLIRHLVPHCTSHELFKYVVDDHATGAFCGRIYVAPGADKTEALQSNRNLVASEHARMYSKPQLEIYADDVKCSHGTAIGQLDPMQIFYMRTRGLSEQAATTLLRQAFMADVIEPVRLERLRTRLRHLVDMRLSGDADTADCGTCAAPDDCHDMINDMQS